MESFDTAESNVLVVVVNFNAGGLLTRVVKAVRLQTHQSFRLVVFDNGSTDDSLAELLRSSPDTEVLRGGENLGFAAANNRVVSAYPRYPWIALLNPDAFPEPTWLEAMLRATRDCPGCGSFTSHMVSATEPEVLDGTGDLYHISGRYWRRDYGCPARGAAANTEVFSACAAAALYSREAWEAAGGFDESYFCYGEDMDLGFRLQLMGFECRYVQDAVVHHVGSAITGRRSEFSVYHGQRNLVWTFVKDMPAPLLWSLLGYHLIINVALVIGLAAHGQGGAVLRAKLHALRGLPRIWRARKRVQGTRSVGLPALWRHFAKGLPLGTCRS